MAFALHSSPRSARPKLGAVLWGTQVVLALVFAFSGSMKLLMPIELLTEQTPLPGGFVRFLGLAETLGALGLILPGLLRIKPGLTPLAAAGLVIIMIGATILTPIFMGPDLVMTSVPLVVGLLAAFVGYGRWQLAPQRGAAARRFKLRYLRPTPSAAFSPDMARPSSTTP